MIDQNAYAVGLSREQDVVAHAFQPKKKQQCDTYTSTLSPLHLLSPQRMISRIYKAWTTPAPIFSGPAGSPLLPLSLRIISLHMVLVAYGWTRGLKRFIRVLFLFTLWSAECYGASAAGLTLRFKHSNSP